MAQMLGLARIGRDVEVRFTANGDPVARISLAFSYGQKDQTGKRPTQWVDGSLWGKRAEALGPHLLKGQLVYVSLDDPHIEEYETRDGQKGSKLAARVSAIEFAGGAPESKPAPTRSAPVQKPNPAPARETPSSSLSDMDDDIPF